MTRLVLITTLLVLALAGPASAKLTVGIGEQNSVMFTDKRWQALEAPDVRYVMPWDAIERNSWELAVLDNYMTLRAPEQREGAAQLRPLGAPRPRAQDAEPAPVHPRVPQVPPPLPRGQDLPDLERGQPRHAADLHEARPRRAALQLDAPDVPRVHDHRALDARRAEHDALDQGLQAQDALPGARLGDPQPHRRQPPPHERHARAAADHPRASCGSRETGGIVNRWVDGRKITRYNQKNAVRAIRNVFKLARINRKRITRIYMYSWIAPPERRPRWDSALVGPKGQTRPSLRTFQAQLRRIR